MLILRLRQLDQEPACEHDSLTRPNVKRWRTCLRRIQKAGNAIAAELGADVRVESDDRGKFPFIGFRLQGFSRPRDAPAEHGPDT